MKDIDTHIDRHKIVLKSLLSVCVPDTLTDSEKQLLKILAQEPCVLKANQKAIRDLNREWGIGLRMIKGGKQHERKPNRNT
jgi:hypothetical protein